MFAWLYNQFVAPILLVLCVLLLIGLGIQSVRINGISVFGLYAVSGYKHDLEVASKTTEAAIEACNKSTQALKDAGDKAFAALQERYKSAQESLIHVQQSNQVLHDQLKKGLTNAKPGDTRPLGPTVLRYLNGVRDSHKGN